MTSQEALKVSETGKIEQRDMGCAPSGAKYANLFGKVLVWRNQEGVHLQPVGFNLITVFTDWQPYNPEPECDCRWCQSGIIINSMADVDEPTINAFKFLTTELCKRDKEPS